MKIDAMSKYPVFRKSDGVASAKAASSSDRAGKTDVVDFSRGQTAAPDKSLLALKSHILRDIAQPMGADELTTLKNSIREGSYHPSTDEIVDAILSK